MADILFNRQYHLFFSVPLTPLVNYGTGWEPTQEIFTPDSLLKYEAIPEAGEKPIGYVTQDETYGFSDLNIKFKIKKSVATEENTCELLIYNADKDLINRLDAYQGKGVACEMRVGSGLSNKTLPLIFSGTVTSATSKRVKSTIQTKIKLTDSSKNTQETYTKRAYRKATPFDKIITDFIVDLGLQKGFVQRVSEILPQIPLTTKQAKSFAGKASSSLKRVCDSLRMDFSIQNGHVYICESGKRIPLFGSTPVLSRNSGVIDELRLADTNSGKLSKDKDGNRAKYTIKTLMLPEIIPHTSVYVQDDEGNNIPYKVEKVTHEGEYEGNPWYTTLGLSSADAIGGGNT